MLIFAFSWLLWTRGHKTLLLPLLSKSMIVCYQLVFLIDGSPYFAIIGYIEVDHVDLVETVRLVPLFLALC